MSLSLFIAEDKGINMEAAGKLAAFLGKTKDLKAVINPVVYCKHGKNRVYFEAWSQNNMPAMEGLRKMYYDADEDKVIVVRQICSWLYDDIQDIKFHCRGLFSGSKTRDALKTLRDSL